MIGRHLAHRMTSRTRKVLSRRIITITNKHSTDGTSEPLVSKKKKPARKNAANNLRAGYIKPTKVQAGFSKMVIVYHDADKAGRHVDIIWYFDGYKRST